jgi:hypothetical protein
MWDNWHGHAYYFRWSVPPLSKFKFKYWNLDCMHSCEILHFNVISWWLLLPISHLKTVATHRQIFYLYLIIKEKEILVDPFVFATIFVQIIALPLSPLSQKLCVSFVRFSVEPHGPGPTSNHDRWGHRTPVCRQRRKPSAQKKKDREGNRTVLSELF